MSWFDDNEQSSGVDCRHAIINETINKILPTQYHAETVEAYGKWCAAGLRNKLLRAIFEYDAPSIVQSLMVCLDWGGLRESRVELTGN